jgi:membrane-bound lytic murein transglycosylase F
MKQTYFLILTMFLLTGCENPSLTLDRIIASGELRFATTEGPVTYYITDQVHTGFEYELANKFADSLGVKLKPVLANNAVDVVSMVANNKVAIGGAALINSVKPEGLISGPSYFSVPLQFIYRRGDVRPAQFADMGRKTLNISAYQMQYLREKYPHMNWNVYRDKDVGYLLRMVHTGKIKSTIADSHFVNIYKHLYPDIRVAFDITSPQPVAWLFKNTDGKLNKAVVNFFNELNSSGDLESMMERYFGHLVAFDYVDTVTFLTRVKKRLPEYKHLFIRTANNYHLDWTLLAAISYQESHWNPSARSPTGVRGLMMLTQDTAEHMGINNRQDPAQSINGGARYFRQLFNKLPERIVQPDRTWLVLAAYNAGFQHIESARVMTQINGGDPDRWSDVRKTLLLFAGDKIISGQNTTNVRWNEPVRYVRNIRKYHDILRWLTAGKVEDYVHTSSLNALNINSPVL